MGDLMPVASSSRAARQLFCPQPSLVYRLENRESQGMTLEGLVLKQSFSAFRAESSQGLVTGQGGPVDFISNELPCDVDADAAGQRTTL